MKINISHLYVLIIYTFICFKLSFLKKNPNSKIMCVCVYVDI